MESKTVPRLQIVAAALFFSTGGAVIKACSFPGITVASFRSGIAALALLILVPRARRFWDERSLLVGIVYAACLTLFVLANKNTTAANTIFLQSTAPLYLLVLSPWLLKERVHARDLAVMAVLAVGMTALVFGGQEAQRTAPHPALGNALAIASGLAWALTVAGLRWMGKNAGPNGPSGTTAVIAGNLIAFFAALPWALPVVGATATDWLAVTFLGVVQIGLAYLCLTAALARIPVLEASLLLFVEPVLNPAWAWWVHGEVPGRWSLAGGAVILAGTLAHSVWSARAGVSGERAEAES